MRRGEPEREEGERGELGVAMKGEQKKSERVCGCRCVGPAVCGIKEAEREELQVDGTCKPLIHQHSLFSSLLF